MILTEQQIIEKIKNKPTSAVWEAARKQAKKLTAHITGIGSDDLVEQITGLENEAQLKLRKKYARSNKDIFARVHRPEDKVFSAKGGSTYYNMSDALKKDFVVRLQNVYHEMSIRQWVESIALQYYHIDPMSLIFIEVGNEVAYPTYKSTAKIHDCLLNGRNVEYVIFTVPGKPNEYRVVDDLFDIQVKYENEVLTVIDTYPNYFGKVPAKIVSDIVAPNTDVFTSPDWEVIEIADEFLLGSSVKSIYKLKHGYPKAWQYESVCQSCKGTGHLNGEECKICNGTGKGVSKDVSEILVLPIPLDGQPSITPDVAGYVTPDIEGWGKMTDELYLLENLMKHTYWGTADQPQTQGVSSDKTATEIMTDTQPMNDRLTKFSKWAEGMETFITDLLGGFYYQSAYKGAAINYGRRYLMEGPDVIWEKYQNARSKGSPISTLDELLTEYYYSKFSSNSMDLNKYLKLMKVEPFIHMSIGEAKSNVTNFDDYNRKLYFTEWLNQLQENEVMLKSVADLNKSLAEYVLAKGLKEPELKQVI